eukprot:m.18843 g.18843  ORF g.18843 m.18843 type:complete len:75 (-) comp8367_c0_seq3:175-399(-)
MNAAPESVVWIKGSYRRSAYLITIDDFPTADSPSSTSLKQLASVRSVDLAVIIQLKGNCLNAYSMSEYCMCVNV